MHQLLLYARNSPASFILKHLVPEKEICFHSSSNVWSSHLPVGRRGSRKSTLVKCHPLLCRGALLCHPGTVPLPQELVPRRAPCSRSRWRNEERCPPLPEGSAAPAPAALEDAQHELIETTLSQAPRTEVSFVAAVLAGEGGEHSRSGSIR